MQRSIFQDIPQRYKIMLDMIQDEMIQKAYSKFAFKYLSYSIKKDQLICGDKIISNDDFNIFLLNFLSIFKFITYHIIDNNFQSENINVTAVFCVEGQCIIIEQIDLLMINETIKNLKKQKVTILKTGIENADNFEIKEEIQGFCSNFQK